MEANVRSRL